jgi:hypothetical protein
MCRLSQPVAQNCRQGRDQYPPCLQMVDLHHMRSYHDVFLCLRNIVTKS